jgi:hypothetical protein
MTDDRKKPGVAFWATVGLVVVLVGYPLSFGPACWIVGRTETSIVKYAEIMYWPILRIAALDHSDGEGPVADAIHDYANFGVHPDSVRVEVMFLRAYLAVPCRGPICGTPQFGH